MPRQDRTFNDDDLVRFYCLHLEPEEQYRFRKKFRENILNRKAICPDDEDGNDYCAWAEEFKKITLTCKDIGEWVPTIISVLGSIEVSLSLLSWVGWWGRFFAFIRFLIAILIQFVIYVGSVVIMVGQLTPFSGYLSSAFCADDESEFEEIDGELPDPDSLPPNPAAEFLDNIEQAATDLVAWGRAIPGWFEGLFE